jgi:hypothetical protein
MEENNQNKTINDTPQPPPAKISINSIKYHIVQVPYIFLLSFSLIALGLTPIGIFAALSLIYYVPKLLYSLWMYWIENGKQKFISDIKSLNFDKNIKMLIFVALMYVLFTITAALIEVFILPHFNIKSHTLLNTVAFLPKWFVLFIDVYLLYSYREKILNKIKWVPKNKITSVLFKLIIGMLFFLILVGGNFMIYEGIYNTQHPAQIACTADAKVCPGGSTVGRVGPHCEFGKCPVVTPNSTDNWETHINDQYGFSIKYPPGFTRSKEGKESPVDFAITNGKTSVVFIISKSLPNHEQDAGGKKIILDGVQGLKFPAEDTQPIRVHLNYNGYYYQILLGGGPISESETLFDQILSTLKFTGAVVTPPCTPRPTCLDAEPRCMMPELSTYCPSVHVLQ